MFSLHCSRKAHGTFLYGLHQSAAGCFQENVGQPVLVSHCCLLANKKDKKKNTFIAAMVCFWSV